jgi:hypothetical protein
VVERRWRSNDGEASVASNEVPTVLQLEEGKGEYEPRLQRGDNGGADRAHRGGQVSGGATATNLAA